MRLLLGANLLSFLTIRGVWAGPGDSAAVVMVQQQFAPVMAWPLASAQNATEYGFIRQHTHFSLPPSLIPHDNDNNYDILAPPPPRISLSHHAAVARDAHAAASSSTRAAAAPLATGAPSACDAAPVTANAVPAIAPAPPRSGLNSNLAFVGGAVVAMMLFC